MSIESNVPLCRNCPLIKLTAELGDAECIRARNRVADAHYNEFYEPHELSDKLVDEGFNPNLSDEAVNCLGQIMRRYCFTANIGLIPTKAPNEYTMGVIART